MNVWSVLNNSFCSISSDAVVITAQLTLHHSRNTSVNEREVFFFFLKCTAFLFEINAKVTRATKDSSRVDPTADWFRNRHPMHFNQSGQSILLLRVLKCAQFFTEQSSSEIKLKVCLSENILQ